MAEAKEKATDRGDDDDDITTARNEAAKDAVPKPTTQRNFTDLDARIIKRANGSLPTTTMAMPQLTPTGKSM